MSLAVVGAVEGILIFRPLAHALGLKRYRKQYPQMFDGKSASAAVEECLRQDGYPT